MVQIAAVVPVLNEAPNIEELVTRLSASLGEVASDYAILVIDDGSSDNTWSELQRMAARDGRVGGLRLNRNFGQHAAISAGLKFSDADWVVVMDGDLQDRPEVIAELFAKAQEGHDCVFVERQDRPEGGLYLAGQKLFYTILRGLTQGNFDGRHGNFSIISRGVVENYNRLKENSKFYGGLLDWLGYPRETIKAAHGERYAGTPSYNLFRRIRFAKHIILSFSTRPLDLTLAIGLVMTLGAFLFGLTIFIRALFFGYSVEGWASLMVSIYFLGGVQMVMIGMVGLYVGRIYDEAKGRPPHIVAEALIPRVFGSAEAETK